VPENNVRYRFHSYSDIIVEIGLPLVDIADNFELIASSSGQINISGATGVTITKNIESPSGNRASFILMYLDDYTSSTQNWTAIGNFTA
jgi:hypothetical protein